MSVPVHITGIIINNNNTLFRKSANQFLKAECKIQNPRSQPDKTQKHIYIAYPALSGQDVG